MDSRTRRVKEMGERVLDWSTAHPDPDPGSAAALSRLQQLVTRLDELASRQRDGILEVRRATARKRTCGKTSRRSTSATSSARRSWRRQKSRSWQRSSGYRVG